MNSKSQKNELLQLLFLICTLFFVFAVFFLTPSLRPASLLTVVNLLFMAPAVRFLSRKGIPKTYGIILIFSTFGLVLGYGAFRAIEVLISQWASLVAILPILGETALNKIGHLQTSLQDALNIEFNLGVANWLITLEKNTQDWSFTHAPTILSDIASAAILAPIFSFFLLKDADKIKASIQKLIPKSYSESTVHVVQKTITALVQFLRAKLLEALLVYFMIYVGLKIIGAPYSGVFALIAGVTNIIPYLGPVLGLAPALLLMGFSDQYLSFFWPTLIVFAIVNAIDMVLVFPVFVAKLVNLSPLTLLAAVALGQELYGLIGMLLAVPIASVFKIIFQELVHVIYQ